MTEPVPDTKTTLFRPERLMCVNCGTIYRPGEHHACAPAEMPDAEWIGRPEESQRTNIISVMAPGYDFALFFNEDGGAEAVVTRPNKAPIGVNIAPPRPGRRIVITRVGALFSVDYEDDRR